MNFTDMVETTGKVIDAAGVAIIVIGAFGAVLQYLVGLRRVADREVAYRTLRKNLGRAILLGLEFLIAGDIIKTVAITPTFTSVGTLAIIVAIRTVLSVELELEIDGRWPWQRRAADGAAKDAT